MIAGTAHRMMTGISSSSSDAGINRQSFNVSPMRAFRWNESERAQFFPRRMSRLEDSS
jgi:hypothetical protein